MRSLIAPAVLAAALAGVTVRAAAQELTPAPGAVDDPLRPEGVATVIVPFSPAVAKRLKIADKNLLTWFDSLFESV